MSEAQTLLTVSLVWIPLALFFVASINAGLGLLVYRASRRAENHLFALTSWAVAGWALTNALFRLAGSAEMALLWAQISYGCALLTAASFLHFALIAPRFSPRRTREEAEALPPSKAVLVVVYGLALGITLSSLLPDWMVREVVPNSELGLSAPWRIVTGPGLLSLAAFMLGATAIAFALFWRNGRELRGRAQAQARYVLLGSGLTATIGLFCNLLLPLLWGDYRWVWLGPLGSLFFVGFTVYSIVTGRLFDVRLLIRRAVLYSLLLALIAGSFAALGKALETLLSPMLGGQAFTTDLIAALLVGFAIDPLKRSLDGEVAKRLFQKELPARTHS